MEDFSPIEFHQQRDFSRKLNATFEFIKQNFKPITKSILLIAGPPVLVGSAFMGSFMGQFLNLSITGANNPEVIQDFFLSANLWVQIFLMFVFLLISGVATISTINSYIVLYGEKKTNKIEVAEVWERVKSTFGMYLGTTILFTLLAIAAYIVLIIPVAILSAISPFLIFIGLLGLICLYFYLIFSVSLTFFIRAYEKAGFFEALRRSFYLVRGKWWSTFGLLLVLYLVAIFGSYIFMIPWYVMNIMAAIHNVSTGTIQEPSLPTQALMMTLFALYYLVQVVLYTLPNVGIAFQYFNLVELKEAHGLMQKIQTFGQPDQNNRPEEHF